MGLGRKQLRSVLYSSGGLNCSRTVTLDPHGGRDEQPLSTVQGPAGKINISVLWAPSSYLAAGSHYPETMLLFMDIISLQWCLTSPQLIKSSQQRPIH